MRTCGGDEGGRGSLGSMLSVGPQHTEQELPRRQVGAQVRSSGVGHELHMCCSS